MRSTVSDPIAASCAVAVRLLSALRQVCSLS